ncbi:MAG: hypothetical protein V8Q32_04945 [Anaerotignum faecicola]
MAALQENYFAAIEHNQELSYENPYLFEIYHTAKILYFSLFHAVVSVVSTFFSV